ncbi:Suppressor of cytokine signaling 2 [Heterocephalus glaber]|uniref:Suppressor of cytokine signaling 2 n=1 Tax=Heterocephalus glaber TaxID=10181 RepID=G5B013_HETGA|nr:Suppressor of cytokine signaling 2 [Heterocephalus glaber]
MTLRCLEPSGNGAEGAHSQWGTSGSAEEPSPEAARLAKALRELGYTGWYWGNMTVNEAKEKLKEAPEGTFLIRDSSHSDYLLTISVKTSAGPTNLRIEYQDGKFRLDSIICVKSKLKQFDSVVHLIDYYVQMCKDKRTGPEAPRNGTVHLYLTKPLYTSAPSLQHLCRLTINKCTGTVWGLPLPTRLKDYLEEYKFRYLLPMVFDDVMIPHDVPAHPAALTGEAWPGFCLLLGMEPFVETEWEEGRVCGGGEAAELLHGCRAGRVQEERARPARCEAARPAEPTSPSRGGGYILPNWINQPEHDSGIKRMRSSAPSSRSDQCDR